MKLDRRSFKFLAMLIFLGVGAHWALQNLPMLSQGFHFVMGILSPFIVGIVIAFVFNIPMRCFESKWFANIPKKIRRLCSFVLVLVIAALVLLFVILLVIPQLVASVVSLTSSFPAQFQRFLDGLTQFEHILPQIQNTLESVHIDWNQFLQKTLHSFQAGVGSVLSSAFNVAGSIISGTFDLVISIIFACYILFDKEHLCRQAQKVTRAYCSDTWYHRLQRLAQIGNRIFRSFVTGQCLECLAIGSVFAIVLSLVGFSYSLLIAVLIGVLSIIPIFGAFLACFIGAFLILVEQGFGWCLLFVIIFIVIQQLDGNFIYPRIVGNSVGLPAIWVLVAVTLGGSMMGIAGMIFFIPLFSVLYTLGAEDTHKRLAAKDQAAD